MSAVPIGYAMHLRTLASDIKLEVERLDRTMGHRQLWLDKTDNVSDDHIVDAYTRTVDSALDRVLAKACAAKEAVRALRGEGL